jgi:hypothetical protein
MNPDLGNAIAAIGYLLFLVFLIVVCPRAHEIPFLWQTFVIVALSCAVGAVFMHSNPGVQGLLLFIAILAGIWALVFRICSRHR